MTLVASAARAYIQNTHINTHPPSASSGQAAMEMLLSFPAGAYKRNELESRDGGKEKHSPVILSKAESMYGLGIFSSRNIVSFLLYFSLSLSSSLSLSLSFGDLCSSCPYFFMSSEFSVVVTIIESDSNHPRT